MVEKGVVGEMDGGSVSQEGVGGGGGRVEGGRKLGERVGMK